MDPYSPPNAELVSSAEHAIRRSVAWKLYFALYALLTLVSYPFIFLDPLSGVVEYVSLAQSALTVLGLFGYAFSRRYFTHVMWRAFLYLSVLFSIVYPFVTGIDLQGDLTDSEYYLTTAIGWVIVFPAFYALFAYSRRAYPLWAKAPGGAGEH